MLDEAERKIVDDVAQYGFHSVNVGDGEPNFRYSIGFWESVGSPDLIVFGLEPKLMHNMLWEMFRQIQAGSSLSNDRRYSGLIEGFDCIVREVHPSQLRSYFGFGLWYRRYKGRDPMTLAAYQVFWPGATQGLFPWESGCVEDVRDFQPLLYLARTDQAG